MTNNNENVIEFPREVSVEIQAIADNIKSATTNLKQSANILSLHPEESQLQEADKTRRTLAAAQKLTTEAKNLTRQINLLSSNLLK
jgi:predicted DNA-binding protein YlxM (UPF0122 family)